MTTDFAGDVTPRRRPATHVPPIDPIEVLRIAEEQAALEADALTDDAAVDAAPFDDEPHESELERAQRQEREEAEAIQAEGNGELGAETSEQPFHGGTELLPIAYAPALAAPLAPIKWLCRDFGLAPGRPVLFSGYGGAGKTFVSQQLALCVAAGISRAWDQIAIQSHGPVLHIDYEQTFDLTRWRYQRLCEGMEIDFAGLGTNLSLASLPPLYLTHPKAEDELRFACAGKALCLIDNLRAACPGIDENDSKIRLYLDILTRVTQATGCLFVVIVHEGKGSDAPDGRKGSQKVRGSGAIVDASSATVHFSGNGHDILTVAQGKASMGSPGDAIYLKFVDVGDIDPSTGKSKGLRIEWVPLEQVNDQADESPAAKRTKVAVVETIRKHGPVMSGNKIRELTMGNDHATRYAIKSLVAEGILNASSGPRGATLYSLAPSNDSSAA